MRGGAAIAAGVIADIREGTEEAIDKAHVDDALADTRAHFARILRESEHHRKTDAEMQRDMRVIRADGENIVKSMRRLDGLVAEEMEDADEQVGEMLGGRVADILPAFNKLTADLLDKNGKNLAALVRIRDSIAASPEMAPQLAKIDELVRTSEREREAILARVRGGRARIEAAVKGHRGGEMAAKEPGVVAQLESMLFGMVATSIGAYAISACVLPAAALVLPVVGLSAAGLGAGWATATAASTAATATWGAFAGKTITWGVLAGLTNVHRSITKQVGRTIGHAVLEATRAREALARTGVADDIQREIDEAGIGNLMKMAL